MKVYLLTGSTGSWDSYMKHVIGIYSTQWKAEMAREKTMEDRTAHITKYTEEQREELDDRYHEWLANADENEKMPKELEEYSNWYTIDPWNEQMEIQEVEVDSTLYRM